MYHSFNYSFVTSTLILGHFSVVEAILPGLAETSLLPLFVFLVDFPEIKKL